MTGTETRDIDTGWAFVIAFAYFFTKVIVVGISLPSSIFYIVFLEEFEQLPSTTALATSLNTFALFFGELSNLISSILGCRATVVIGCIMSSVGMLLTSFAPNLPCVIFAYGLLTGVGFSLTFFPSFPMVPIYFKKYRKLVFIVGSSGMSVGIFVLPLLSTYLIDKYHWRGAFMILSAINLNFLVIAATYFKPRSSTEVVINMESLLPKDDTSSEKRRSTGTCERAATYFRHNFRLLKLKRYSLFLFGFIMYGIGSSAFYTHVVNMAIIRGFSKEQAAFLPSVVGITGIAGRLLIIFLTHVLRLSVILIFVVLFCLTGILMAMYGFLWNFYLMMACCVGIGFLLSVSALEPEMVIEIVGLRNLSTGISCLCLLFAFGSMLGGPLSGWAFEMDSTYRSSFILAGISAMVTGVANIPAWVHSRKTRFQETK